MEIIHVSAECYPMAKTGGLADVVGALPKYQNRLGQVAKVVMPMHRTKFLFENEWEVVHKAALYMGEHKYEYTVIKEKTNKLEFDLYCIDIYGLLDREKVYGYDDDTERFLIFQIAVVEWLGHWQHLPDVIHCHDHHTALIPFMTKYCYAYQHLSQIATVLTIHNGQYQGWMSWEKAAQLPAWDSWRWGLLDWEDIVNPLACGIKCADRVTTVSPGYMKELMEDANGLESLIRQESGKCQGIINGIDYEVWNPKTDSYLDDNFSLQNMAQGKLANKKSLCKEFGFDEQLPLFIFIGRLVAEKAADILPWFVAEAFAAFPSKFSLLILGSGDKEVERQLTAMNSNWVGYYNSKMEYNEKLSHTMYAGADFLLMPSRVEPCGLNQLYAMRYGTVPVVRRIGGLQDTVLDFGDEGGYGVCFRNSSVEDMMHALSRSLELYAEPAKMKAVRKAMTAVDTSWNSSANKYIELYKSI